MVQYFVLRFFLCRLKLGCCLMKETNQIWNLLPHITSPSLPPLTHPDFIHIMPSILLIIVWALLEVHCCIMLSWPMVCIFIIWSLYLDFLIRQQYLSYDNNVDAIRWLDSNYLYITNNRFRIWFIEIYDTCQSTEIEKGLKWHQHSTFNEFLIWSMRCGFRFSLASPWDV